MSAILPWKPRRGLWLPGGQPRINPAHAAAGFLSSAVPFTTREPHDLLGRLGKASVGAGTPTLTAGGIGSFVSFNTARLAMQADITGNCSVVLVAMRAVNTPGPATYPTVQTVMATASNGSGAGIEIDLGNGYLAPADVVVVQQWASNAAIAVTGKLWVDGVLQTSGGSTYWNSTTNTTGRWITVGATFANVATGTYPVTFGAFGSGAFGLTGGGGIALCLVFNRILPDAMMAELTRDPGAALLWPDDDIWASLVGVAGGTTYNDTVTDPVTASDTAGATLIAGASVSDSGTASDSTTGALTTSTTISDSTTASDAPSSAQVMPQTVSDGVNSVDLASATAVFGETISDPTTASDSATGGSIFSDTVSDSTTAGDSQSDALTALGSVSETVASLDIASAIAVYNVTISDSVTAGDNVSDGNIYNDTISDGLSAGDNASASVTPAGIMLPSKRISALDPTVVGSAMPDDVVPVTQMTTGPNTGWTKKFPLSALAQGVGVGINVLAFGAVGDGVTDDTVAIQEALTTAALSPGSSVIFPPGIYRTSATLLVSSKTQIIGYGAEIRPGAEANWTSTYFYCIANINNEAAVITDEYITVEGLTINYVDLISSPDGSRHEIYMRKAQHIRILNCNFLEGGDAVAFKATNDTLIQGCYAKGFKNCAWDHWDGPTNGRVIGNYAEATPYNEAQIMNWNPDSDAPILNGLIAANFIATGNVFVSTDTVATPIQIEPLRNNGTKVRNVSFTGNTLINCSLQMRGDIANAVVSGNTFSDTAGGGSVFNCYTFVGGTPVGVWFSNNVINNPTTSSGFGVIRHEGTTGGVVGNVIQGYSPANPAHTTIYTTSRNLVLFGNQSSHSIVGVTGSMGNGDTMLANASVLGWWDSVGNRAKMRMTSGNIWQFNVPDASGNERDVLQITARNNEAELLIFPGVRFSNRQRIIGAVGITAPAGGAGLGYQIQANFVQITTCVAGGGVRLPTGGANFITGAFVVIMNDGANTLTVYPQSGGSINGGAVDASISLAAGGTLRLYALTNLTWRSW